MLIKLSRKAFSPFGVKEINKIKLIHKEPFFLIGLFLKISLVFYSFPLIHSDLFIPFISNSISNISLDPWNSFLLKGGNINSFPYGISMLISYWPLSSFGLFLERIIDNYDFLVIGFKLSSLIFDYSVLILLSIITKHFSNRILLISYWLSPIIIYTTYIHGQLDIVPVAFLLGCICMINWNRYRSASLFIVLAISSKMSMLIAFPFILIYLQKRKGFNKEFFNFIFSSLILGLFFFLPFLASEGFWTMVLKTREIERLYVTFIPFNNLKLYVVPIIYILSLYLVWRLKRITQDLFLIATGLGFFSILIFVPAAPGWFIWILPFLTFYQVKSKKDFIFLGFLFNLFTVLNIYLNSKGAFINIPFFENIFYLGKNENFRLSNHFNNLVFSAQKSLSILFAIRMYFYGLRRNNFYGISSNPLLISIAGNEKIIINKFIKTLKKLFPEKDLNILIASDCLNTKQDNQSFSSIALENNTKENKNTKTYKPYYANQISECIQLLNKLIDNNKKDYILFVNDIGLTQEILFERIDISININASNDFERKFSLSNNYSKNSILNFEFKDFHDVSNISHNISSLTTYFPIGFLHAQIQRLSIAIASLNVDTEVSQDKEWIKMTIQGYPSSEDNSLIAQSIIPEIDDYSLKEESWSPGYFGIMQIILLATISKTLKKVSINAK